MGFLEYIFYESLPYLYGALSIFAFMNHEASKMAGLAAIILAVCSYQVFMKRYQYRMFTSKYKRNIHL